MEKGKAPKENVRGFFFGPLTCQRFGGAIRSFGEGRLYDLSFKEGHRDPSCRDEKKRTRDEEIEEASGGFDFLEIS